MSPRLGEVRGAHAVREDTWTELLRLVDAHVASEPSEPGGWLREFRKCARESLGRKALPTPKDERWRFTPLALLLDPPSPLVRAAPPASKEIGQRVAASLGYAARLEGVPRILVVNGRWLATSEEASLPDGIEISSLLQPLQRVPGEVEAGLRAALPGERVFSTLNAALFPNGLLVRIRKGVVAEVPIEIVHVATAEAPSSAHARTLVIAEEDSAARLVETHLGAGACLGTSVMEVALGRSAEVEHVRIQKSDARALHLGRVRVVQAAASRYASRVFDFGAPLARLELDVELSGRDAECSLSGVYVLTGHDHVEHHTAIDHREAHGRSTERYKGVLDGASRGVFEGTIQVSREAHGTLAHQENRNLLLSNDAVVNTKPRLDIESDDVRCSHGATVGHLDPEQIFYLRSRGIGEPAARAIVTSGFVRELVDMVSFAPLRSWIESELWSRLPRENALTEAG
jgi:Fe-S cluster assembly protein SufD